MSEKKRNEDGREKKPFMPVVYISSPYRGDVERNTGNARRFSRLAVDMGYIPYAPHLLHPQYMNDSDEKEREKGLYMGLVMIDKCKELWVFGDTITEGMRGEIERAKMRRKTIRYFSCEGKEKKGNE